MFSEENMAMNLLGLLPTTKVMLLQLKYLFLLIPVTVIVFVRINVSSFCLLLLFGISQFCPLAFQNKNRLLFIGTIWHVES